jgi:hypothetical protein
MKQQDENQGKKENGEEEEEVEEQRWRKMKEDGWEKQ